MSWVAPGPGQGVFRGPDPQAQVRSSPGPPGSLRLEGLYVQRGTERPQGALVIWRDTAPSWAASSDSEPVRQPEQRSGGRGQALTWPLAMPDPSPGSRRLGDSPRWRRRLCCSVCPDPRAGGTPYKLRSLAVGSSLCAPKPNKFPSDFMLLTASVRTRLPEATRGRQSSPGQTRRAAARPRPPAGHTRTREGQRQAPQLLPFSPRFLRGNLMSPPQ